MINVTVWNEFLHEQQDEKTRQVHPDGIHNTVANFLKCDDFNIRTATLDMPEHGLTDEVLNSTDVLLWWGHMGHDKVSDEIVEKVYNRVLAGMGLIVLHSGHHSKIFRKLMGTTCNLNWHECAKERVWCVNPTHPIAEGVDRQFMLECEEVYGEEFDIPTPDDLIFISWFSSGEVFRSGCTFNRGYGKIFYFQPGHETYHSFENENVQKIIRNGIYWAKPARKIEEPIPCPFSAPLETGEGII